MPLIYSGQEAGLDKRLEFFEKDRIEWGKDPEMTALYANLIALKKSSQALWNGEAGGEIRFLETSDPGKMLAFQRAKEESCVLVLMNLSEQPVRGEVDLGEKENYRQFPTDKTIVLEGTTAFEMEPWSYRIFTKE